MKSEKLVDEKMQIEECILTLKWRKSPNNWMSTIALQLQDEVEILITRRLCMKSVDWFFGHQRYWKSKTSKELTEWL